jgi:glutathione S-transferase
MRCQIWRAKRFVADEKDFSAVEAKGRENLREQHAYIESLLADGRDWAAPGGYSVVDPYLLVFYCWGKRIGLDMRALYAAWTRLTQRIVTRPAVERFLIQEEITIF